MKSRPEQLLLSVPSGRPKRRTMAFSCDGTVKTPEAKNTITKMIMTNRTMAKLLRNASDSACEPASSAVMGARSGGDGIPRAASSLGVPSD